MPKIICKGAKNKGFSADAVVTTGMQIGEKKMPKYTNVEKLYERFASLEEQALTKVTELSRIPLGVMTEKEYIMFRVWSAIYQERSAFKHDVFDSPTADVQEVKHGKWIVNIPEYKSTCSVCGADEVDFAHGTEMWYGLGKSNFCPNCGVKMDL